MGLESSETPDFRSLHESLKKLASDIEAAQKDHNGFVIDPEQRREQQSLLDEVRGRDTLFATEYEGWSPGLAYDSRVRILKDLQSRWNYLFKKIFSSEAEKYKINSELVVFTPDDFSQPGMETINAISRSTLLQAMEVVSKPNSTWENW